MGWKMTEIPLKNNWDSLHGNKCKSLLALWYLNPEGYKSWFSCGLTLQASLDALVFTNKSPFCPQISFWGCLWGFHPWQWQSIWHFEQDADLPLSSLKGSITWGYFLNTWRSKFFRNQLEFLAGFDMGFCCTGCFNFLLISIQSLLCKSFVVQELKICVTNIQIHTSLRSGSHQGDLGFLSILQKLLHFYAGLRQSMNWFCCGLWNLSIKRRELPLSTPKAF